MRALQSRATSEQRICSDFLRWPLGVAICRYPAGSQHMQLAASIRNPACSGLVPIALAVSLLRSCISRTGGLAAPRIQGKGPPCDHDCHSCPLELGAIRTMSPSLATELARTLLRKLILPQRPGSTKGPHGLYSRGYHDYQCDTMVPSGSLRKSGAPILPQIIALVVRTPSKRTPNLQKQPSPEKLIDSETV